MRRSKRGNKESENEALYKQCMNLQKDWDSFKQSNYKSVNFPQISAKSDSSSSTLDIFKLLENSPRSLMSSLQDSESPLEERLNWKAKKNDLAVEEILRDRKTALASGKLKGRRLFEENDEKSCISEEEICSDCLGLLKQMDGNDSLISCSSTSTFATEKESKDREIWMVEGNLKASVNLPKRKRKQVEEVFQLPT
ncbi:PREDICTED: uncharacterized protein LOC109244810 isoform X1 [Nicotiana attenuata]|uniref:uncharacterized protein LOC109244810 isoform X1 n=1 Tax=Nicotiana attenuata TaxID=49451 RepID=UPI000904B044|nr:PREDICTED: uncharacterized protein LOC109244810 isoform X1 [Nicotiana attenuata]